MTDTTMAVEKKASIEFGRNGVQISTFEGLYRFSKLVMASGMAPKGMNSPEAICIAIQMGFELGLTPMSALQNIGVINGRPAIYGDAALALVRQSGLLESYSQEITGEGDARTATVTAKRTGDSRPITATFSVANAKAAQLWGRSTTWTQYPDRMMLFRARGFVLRDGFCDVLKGLKTYEEVADYPKEINITPTPTPEAPKSAATKAVKNPVVREPAPTPTPEMAGRDEVVPQVIAPSVPVPEKPSPAPDRPVSAAINGSPLPIETAESKQRRIHLYRVVSALAKHNVSVKDAEAFLHWNGELKESKTFSDLPSVTKQTILDNVASFAETVGNWLQDYSGEAAGGTAAPQDDAEEYVEIPDAEDMSGTTLAAEQTI